MHLLAASPGDTADGAKAVDLGQTPADIVVLTAADTEIACLAAAQRAVVDRRRGSAPSLRLANFLHLGHNLSVDLYVEGIVRRARLVVVRLLGGRAYWPYGVDEIAAAAGEEGIPVAFLPGDDQPDATLMALTTCGHEAAHRLWQYLVHGGVENAGEFLAFAATLIGAGETPARWREPKALPRAGLYWPGLARPALGDIEARWRAGAPVAAVVFYRALAQAANLGVIDALIEALAARGLNALPLYATSLRDPLAAPILRGLLEAARPALAIACTAFSQARPGKPADSVFAACPGPVLQAVLAGSTEKSWRAGWSGLSARDIAMNVALPEVDGRLLTRAISFKGLGRRDALTQADIVTHQPAPDRIAWTAQLAAAWARLAAAPPASRRVALILANYPNRDGRLGNGVGLDTPAATVLILKAMAAAGYTVADAPADGAALVRRLQAGPTNAGIKGRDTHTVLPLAAYRAFFDGLPEGVRARVTERWGAPEDDPFMIGEGMTHIGGEHGFAMPVLRCGAVAVALQPARGYNIDPAASYHDPALPPPHHYIAFYAWLRVAFDAHALVHVGKHGNLEWLPGKALALSAACFPEAVMGPLPHLYPFIVNDPGEGAQAKRRAAAVIVDHMTPPLTRAETYGPLRALEGLVDEYYQAAALDPRRLPVLRRDIIAEMAAAGLDRDLGVTPDDEEGAVLQRLDAYLCELKEMQIRDGLHVFGRSPAGRQRRDLAVALLRCPRGPAPEEASLTRALAGDLGLGFDPLDCDLARPWDGPRPPALAGGDALWRSAGDTVERLEALAARLVAGETDACDGWPSAWPATRAVLAHAARTLLPALDTCGAAEVAGLLAGLDGRFVPPGPSGAPTRGRPDVLPTGRNFYSVDLRALPTPAAWELGVKSATLLVERYAQEHGTWPRAMALSAWGTSNMRTGGDDIAQALALLGVRPCWDSASGRVVGVEVMALEGLGRPRVDVTLRVSGFFRDAFPNLIALVDEAVRLVAGLAAEGAADNPLRAHVVEETAALRASGVAEPERRARYRVFGSMPGAYGAGLQALIDERGWSEEADLARAYVAWGGYAYGAGAEGVAAHAAFERRLGLVEAVVHNQDNREHDLLDSDDYYQFEGGLAAAVAHHTGRRPAIYHNDHSRPFAPKVRRLEEEVARVVRARAVNPKWIAGALRHGYKGVFEMAATVDYLFAFAATTGAVRDDQFDMVYAAYIGDEAVREEARRHNPAALAEMAARFLEAQDRGLWRPRSNAARPTLEALCG